MSADVQAVLAGERQWVVQQADCLHWLAALPADSIDLCLFSPPYERARLYLENGQDMGIARNTEEWVAWMVEIIRACSRVCRGLICCVCEGQTRSYRWTAGPALLMADLHRAGFNLRKPPAYHRVGIPGSGGPDWLRNDYEFCICVTRPGRLPWSDNTACGHPPKWAPGGEMSHRLGDGRRRNQWGGVTKSRGHRNADGTRDAHDRPSHVITTNRELKARRVVRGTANGDTETSDSYIPPVLANPGNVLHFKVGGGLLGHPLAHENEAPYPLGLAELFVQSFCQPGGIVCDPFSGSGTTGHAAILHGRRYLGCDLRESQVDLTSRRLEGITPMMFAATEEG